MWRSASGNLEIVAARKSSIITNWFPQNKAEGEKKMCFSDIFSNIKKKKNQLAQVPKGRVV